VKDSKKIVLSIIITFVVTLLLCALAVFWFLSKCSYPLERLSKIMSIIDESYIGEYSLQECEEGAINGLLYALGDDYAVYYNEENAKETMQEIEGYYIGIGVGIFPNTEKGYLEVISTREDSPAELAGIKSGDFLKEIDGKTYSASQMADAVLYMKGTNIENPLDKVVKITLLRGEEEITVELKREKLELFIVTHKMIDNICYIRYSGFSEKSFDEFKKIVENLDSNTEGIVVDIRNNPGGEFGSSINMCDLFLDENLIMYTTDKKVKGQSILPLREILIYPLLF